MMSFVKLSVVILIVDCFVNISSCIHIGQFAQGRIIQGSNATTNQFPYYASVIGLTLNDNSLCGGSIISRDWILTAATCLIGSTKFKIGVGSIFLTAPQISMISTEAYQHEHFNSNTLSNNIALIKLPASLSFFDNIQPLQLVSSTVDNSQFIYSRATIAGYGRLSDTEFDLSLILQWINLRIISNAECLRYFITGKVVTYKNFCAHGYLTREHSPCVGDFGGPLITFDDDGRPIQIGITSFVSQYGCTTGRPSVYLVVSHYLNWISSITGIKLE